MSMAAVNVFVPLLASVRLKKGCPAELILCEGPLNVTVPPLAVNVPLLLHDPATLIGWLAPTSSVELIVSAPVTSNCPASVLVPEPAKITLLKACAFGLRLWLLPLNATVPLLAVNVPALLHVPETFMVALGALKVVPEFIVKFPNCVPSIDVPPIMVVPVLEKVTIPVDAIENPPPLAVKFAPTIVTLNVLASKVPLFRAKSPLTVIVLSSTTFPATVRLFRAVPLEGNSRLVVKFPLYATL